MTKTLALKPCPWCGPKGQLRLRTEEYCKIRAVSTEDGGEQSSETWHSHGIACCDRCGVFKTGATEAEAIAAWNERPGETALLAACRDSAAFFDEIIKGFNITNDDAQSIRLRDQLRAVIASVEPQSERT